MDFSFKTDYSLIFIPLIFAVSAAVAYLYYRNSDQDSLKKKLFTILRFLSVFFILLLFLSPVISYVKNIMRKPVNVFLIDNSQSMTIDSLNKELSEVLEDKVKKSLPGNSENIFYLFSENLNGEITESGFGKIDFTGKNSYSTNLTSSLSSLQEALQGKSISSVTIISDGIINDGGNPSVISKSFNAPVNYILYGDTVQQNDLVLKNVYYNKNAFIESSIPIKAEISSYNYDREISISLFEENKKIESKNITVSRDRINYEIPFSVMNLTEGIRKYRVEIAGLDDEVTLRNNSEEFYINFTDNKFKVLVLAGSPGADLAFFKEEISRIRNFETDFLTQKSPGEFYEGTLPELGKYDSYILFSYPTSISNPSILNQLKDNLEKNNSSLIFFAGKNVDYKKLEILESRLPFKVQSLSGAEEETVIRSVSKVNPEIFKNTVLISSVNNFPPVFKTASVFTVNPSAETFLLMGRNSEAAFVIENSSENKSAAFLAYGFYKWRLNSQNNNSPEVLNYIIASSVTAVSSKDSKNKLKIETTKPVYSKFENVKFTGSVNDVDMSADSKIKVDITGKDFNKIIELSKVSGNNYEGEVNIETNGDYDFSGSISSGSGGFEERVKGRFSIGENNNEFKSTRADNTVLSLLSNSTGGHNFTHMSPGEIKDSLSVTNDKLKSGFTSLQNFDFSINPYYLMFVILLLCAEWFFRKRNNLP